MAGGLSPLARFDLARFDRERVMVRCPECSGELPGSARFCLSCGAPLAPGRDGGAADGPAAGGGAQGRWSPESPTRTSLPSDAGFAGQGPGEGLSPTLRLGTGRPPASPFPSSALDEGRFAPGSLLLGRYRIIGLLGRGGMGEVYRADDLTLGQRVALKFLPVSVGADPGRLGRFFNEVRTARQVSHPNVCRVHDVGVIEGDHFISMEYVDGEDLATLLRRIGRLPRDKGVEIARQLCAGIAAAHDQGILHRDLKPANVMIDGRGRVRIADFGLASLAEGVAGAEVLAGTPQYMAPEQHAGKEVSVRSDIYALGLVLYEMFTGRHAFPAGSAAELLRLQEQTTPAGPSTIVPGLDPAVERVILRCLERDPDKRPRSAIAVAAALPGGDPIAAALAAGETPAPELLAEAGVSRGLSPGLAWACLAAFGACMALVVALSPRTKLTSLVPLENPPAVLIKRSRDLIAMLGASQPPRDSSFGYIFDQRYFEEIAATDRSPDRWAQLADPHRPSIVFWYRQSPRVLMPVDERRIWPNVGDPPPLLPGMETVFLDSTGRLQMIYRVPPRHDPGPGPWSEPDWKPLLAETGLDPASLRPVPPVWTPRINTDSRTAWEGHYTGLAEPTVRVEVGAFRGTPCYLETYLPWEKPPGATAPAESIWIRASGWMNILALLSGLGAGALAARRNYLLGRGDRKGAFRLGMAVSAAYMAVWLLGAEHVAARSELGLFMGNLAMTVFVGGLAWLFYLALEPYVRRIWPHWLVSWVRLLDGRIRDPLVGRDLLLGSVLGSVLALLVALYTAAPAWFGLPPPRPDMLGNPANQLAALPSFRHSAALTLWVATMGVVTSLALIFLLRSLRLVLRKQWLALAATIAVMTLVSYTPAGAPAADLLVWAAFSTIFLGALARFGLLTGITGFALWGILSGLPITTDLSRWYASSTVISILVPTAIALYGFVVSFGGTPIFRDTLDPR